ncbi:MAG: hypothetical protein FWH59_03405, partial [Lentimicrobiaceae bacterium]|nr:hypothetical protein [Lentimicrobiaceae bacterium]
MKKLNFKSLFFTICFFAYSFSVSTQNIIKFTWSVVGGQNFFKQNDGFDQILINECSFTEEIGNPQLPIKIISYVLPYNSTVTGIIVNSISQEKLNGNYYIFPTQPPIPLDWSDPPPFVEPNLDIYNSNVPYPNKTVEIISDGYTHGY